MKLVSVKSNKGGSSAHRKGPGVASQAKKPSGPGTKFNGRGGVHHPVVNHPGQCK